MPQKHHAKEICFEMWKAGMPFREIYKRTNVKAATVTNWIRKWELGAQETWTPDMPHRGGYTAQEQDYCSARMPLGEGEDDVETKEL